MKRKVTEWTNFVSGWLYPTILFCPSKYQKKYFNWIENKYPSSF